MVAIAKLFGEGLNLAGVMQNRRQLMLEQFAYGPRVMATDNEDRDLNAGLAQLDAFLDEGHTDPSNASPFERPRQSLGTVSVTIRFEHGPHRDIPDGPSYHVEIVPKVTEVDLSPRRTNGISR
jgi:hypothetical protein